jgi:hypothetical protein
MTLKIRIPRPLFSGARGGMMPLAAGAAGNGANFGATLSECMDGWDVGKTAQFGGVTTRPANRSERKAGTGSRLAGLTRAFSWLQSKYAMTATKRLRVSETVSLGEKRFVALVTVEGREFLIGGGSAGVSLLAQLSNETKGADGLGSALAGGEDAG